MNEKSLNNNREKHNLGIYIHIPFCVKKCDYCDFLSSTESQVTKKKYVKALIDEIQSYHELAKEYKVRTIFIGGGTPSVMEGVDITAIMDSLVQVFSINRDSEGMEITIECNPGTLTQDKLEAYKHAGINRLSIGLQSANNTELKILGRIHTYEEFVENYQRARAVGFTNINVDLMSALPGQTLEGWIHTLNKVISLKPEHISAYSLIIEEGTPFYNRYGEVEIGKSNERISNNQNKKPKDEQYLIPSEEEDRDIYYKTKEFLEDNGYYRYEISNYAKVGYECIHNSSYWERIDYLGLGLGSSSLLHNTRFHNEEQLDKYISLSSDYNKIRREIEFLTVQQQMEEFMFLGLRMSRGISKSEFSLLFGNTITQIYETIILKLLKDNLLIESEDRIYLTEQGMDISNYVLSQFLL